MVQHIFLNTERVIIMDTYMDIESLEEDLLLYTNVLTAQDKRKLRSAFRTFRRLDQKYEELDARTARVALLEEQEDEGLEAAELSLEEFEEKLNKAVANAGAIWNSAYAVLKAAMLETETVRIRVEAREKVIRDQEKAALDLRHKEESKSLPTLQFFRSLKNKGPGNNEDDVHAWANLFIRTLISAAIKPWRWPAAMDSCLGDVHRQWLLQKVPVEARMNILSEDTFRSILLDPFVIQVEGVLGEADKYRSLRYLKQQENQSVAHYTENVVQLQKKLKVDEIDSK